MNRPDFWDSGLRFICTQCSRCCRHDSGYVFLSREDLTRLAGHLDLTASEVVERFCRWVPFGPDAHLSLTEQRNRDCVFWADGGCSVYQGRPLQCRSYPFWQTIVDEEAHWSEERSECPGIGIGPPRPAAEIAAAVAARRLAPPVLRSEWERRAP
mgnify:CR=1 FL=1